MGRYSRNLYRHRRTSQASQPSPTSGERLTACAIVRDGVTHSGSARSHAEVRRALGDKDPYQSQWEDREGFVTSTGRFVNRLEAKRIAQAAGQCPHMERELLSSDVSWS